jgi:hypothetical protein
MKGLRERSETPPTARDFGELQESVDPSGEGE